MAGPYTTISPFINAETGTPFSKAQLNEAFNLVADKENWKNPIDAYIAPDNLVTGLTMDVLKKMVEEAVRFFCGCTPEFVYDGGTYHVTAAGYFAIIGV